MTKSSEGIEGEIGTNAIGPLLCSGCVSSDRIGTLSKEDDDGSENVVKK